MGPKMENIANNMIVLCIRLSIILYILLDFTNEFDVKL